MNKHLIFILILSGLSFSSMARDFKLEGQVIDESGNGLPFATLYIENTTIGTITNADGHFSFELPNEARRIIFQYVGYEKKIIEISPNLSNEYLTVQLQPQSYELKELVVTADGEDPAYRVIREAMKKRKYYENEVSAYSCDVYIKGIQSITEKPDRFLGFKVTIDSGIVYLSESVSKLYFARPDKVKEVMISSKVSGRNNAFSYNQASDMLFNPYENLFKYENLSERGFVSPIANNAMLFYDYQLVGTQFEDSLLINKIKVIGKRPTDPVFNGYIYIVEDSWRIHSVDMLLTKQNQIEFVDSLKVKQVYAPVSKDIWMLLSQKFTFNLSAFGFKGHGNFIGVHSNYEVESGVASSILFPDKKSFFNNELMSVEDGANDRDSSYWNTIRPVPLTQLEARDYNEKDSIQVIKDSKAYKDSIDHETNKIGITNLFLTGYVHSNSFKERYLRFDSFFNAFQYNTVEGPVANVEFSLTKRKDRQVQYQVIPTIRYGFSNDQLNISTKSYFYTNRKAFERWGFQVGKTVRQFNELNPIQPEVNTFETLLNRRNFAKLYSEWSGTINYRRELINGVLLRSSIKYASRNQLFNSSSYSFFDEGEREFTPNAPDNFSQTDTSFPDHQALLFKLSLRLRFAQKFISRPDRKVIVGSKYPELVLSYKSGIPIGNSDINFNFIQLTIKDEVAMGLWGKGRYDFTIDHFISKKNIYFMDFKHFNGNRSFITQFSLAKFQLLDYYFFSTDNRSLEGHYEHHFNGFIMDKIPLLKRTKIQVVGSFHTMKVPTQDTYIEIGGGIEHIFKILRIDYYHSFLGNNKYASGFRFGIGF